MNLEEQLSAVLNDPEAMNKISSIASSLGLDAPAQPGSEDGGGASAPAAAPVAPAAGFRFPDVRTDPRARLLMALKPFLSEKRAPYVDGAVALLSIMKLGGQSGALTSLLSSFGGKAQ